MTDDELLQCLDRDGAHSGNEAMVAREAAKRIRELLAPPDDAMVLAFCRKANPNFLLQDEATQKAWLDRSREGLVAALAARTHQEHPQQEPDDERRDLCAHACGQEAMEHLNGVNGGDGRVVYGYAWSAYRKGWNDRQAWRGSWATTTILDPTAGLVETVRDGIDSIESEERTE
jgi:hypothetical protein